MLTTWEIYKDDSCILQLGDHPFVKHPTCVKYNGFSKTISVEQLELVISQKKLVQKERVSQEVLQKILKGACETKFLPNCLWLVLNEQELVD